MKQNRPQEQRKADTQKNSDNQNIEDLVSNKINNFLNKNNFSKTIQSQINRYEHERNEVHTLKVELKAILQETKADRTKIHELKLRQEKATQGSESHLHNFQSANNVIQNMRKEISTVVHAKNPRTIMSTKYILTNPTCPICLTT